MNIWRLEERQTDERDLSLAILEASFLFDTCPLFAQNCSHRFSLRFSLNHSEQRAETLLINDDVLDLKLNNYGTNLQTLPYFNMFPSTDLRLSLQKLWILVLLVVRLRNSNSFQTYSFAVKSFRRKNELFSDSLTLYSYNSRQNQGYFYQQRLFSN